MNEAKAGPAQRTPADNVPPPGATDAISQAPGPSQPTSAPALAAADDSDIFLGWTRNDRWFFGIAAALVLAVSTVQIVRKSGWGVTPVTVQRPESRKYEFRLEINSATWVEWMQLEGIGEILARRIVSDRETNGPFASIDDVARVNGIGPAKLDSIRPWLSRDAAAEDPHLLPR